MTMDIFNRTIVPRDEKANDLGVIVPGKDQIAYIMHRDIWELVEPVLREYIHRFVKPHLHTNRPYRHRDHGKIREWFGSIVRSPAHVTYVTDPHYPSSQDACVEAVTLRRLTTKVNHVRHIGLYGEHMSPELHRDMGFDAVRLDLFPSDTVAGALRAQGAS